jgi:hypothetical protein
VRFVLLALAKILRYYHPAGCSEFFKEDAMTPTTHSEKRPRGRPAAGAKGLNAAFLAQRERARELGLASLTDWCRHILMNTLPSPLAARPELEHPEQFALNPAQGWKDFLNLPTLPTQDELELLPDVDQRGYVEFDYASEMAKTLHLARAEDWYREAGNLHPCCPREPWAVYFQTGYTTLEAFVGLPEPTGAASTEPPGAPPAPGPAK